MKDFLNAYMNLSLIEIVLIAFIWFLIERIYYFIKDRWNNKNSKNF